MNLHALPNQRTELMFWIKEFPNWNWREDESDISYLTSYGHRTSLTPEDRHPYKTRIDHFIETGNMWR